jgi:hypothetical protein
MRARARPERAHSAGLHALTSYRSALAGFVIALTLAARLMVPIGYMPTAEQGRIALTLCSGAGPVVAHIMPGTAHHAPAEDHGGGDGNGAHKPCGFAGVATPSLAAADPLLLVAAILFALVLALHRRPLPAPQPSPRLRPPLRGPPPPA